METLRYHGNDGPLVYDDETQAYRMPDQDDMDRLSVGVDISDDEWDAIED